MRLGMASLFSQWSVPGESVIDLVIFLPFSDSGADQSRLHFSGRVIRVWDCPRRFLRTKARLHLTAGHFMNWPDWDSWGF